MNLIRREFEARYSRGDSADSITLEAAALVDWLSKGPPRWPVQKAKRPKTKYRANIGRFIGRHSCSNSPKSATNRAD
jgi:hypothetical protein